MKKANLDKVDVNALNKYFAIVAPNTKVEQMTTDFFTANKHQLATNELVFHSVTKNKVVKVICKMKSSTTGVDNINSRMLKMVLLSCLD